MQLTAKMRKARDRGVGPLAILTMEVLGNVVMGRKAALANVTAEVVTLRVCKGQMMWSASWFSCQALGYDYWYGIDSFIASVVWVTSSPR